MDLPFIEAFTASEKEELSEILTQFLNQWAAHPLKTAFDLPYDRFIVIGLDEELQEASGCSIDASVHFIQQLEKKFDVILLDKMNVCSRKRTNSLYSIKRI